MIKVSVIVPVYKVEQYLKECVDSIVGQTYPDIEIILVDDGSPDSCPSICDEYTAQDNRIKVIHQENAGLSQARNAGIKAATGDYLLFVDSDDKLADCDVVQNLADFLQQTKSTVTYCGCIHRLDKNNLLIKKELPQQEDLLLTPVELIDYSRKNRCYLAAWTFIAQRKFVLENSVFFIQDLIHEDTEWVPRLLCADKNIKINVYTKPFYIYRNTPNSITNTFNQNRIDSLCMTLKILVQKINEEPANLFLKKWFNNTLYYLFYCFEHDCHENTPLYQSNIQSIKHLFKNNNKILTPKNKILYLFIIICPKLFFILRRVILSFR